MTQIGIGVEKGKNNDDAQLIINSGRPYVIQPHLQRKKPSTFLYFIAILLTLCVIVLTILGIVWLVRTHIWLSDLQKNTTTARPVPSTPGDVGAESFNDQPRIQSAMTFEDIWTLRPKGFGGQWLNDNSNKMVFRNDSGDLVQHDFDDGVLTTLVANSVFVENNITRYYPNYDGSHVLLIYDEEKVWRHSFRSRALIYDTVAKTKIDFPNSEPLRTERLQFVSWAPKSNVLIFVQGNNIYYQDGPTGNLSPPIIGDGSETIINGIPDWLYEEDVLGSARASYLSDNGQFLVFGRFDVKDVRNVEYPLYLPSSDVYAQQYKAAYPMAGYISSDGSPGPNTKATLHLVDTQQTGTPTPNVVLINPPTELTGDHYFTRVSFVDADTVAITWTNRIQNEAYVQICDLTPSAGATPPAANCRNNFHQVVEDGWIDAPWPAPVANLGADVYYTYLMNNDTEGRYKQLASITIPNTGLGEATFLTSGVGEVQGVINYDEEADVLFYYSNRGKQTDRHVMMMNSTDTGGGVCLTCEMELGKCDYASVQFSSSKDFFLLSCLGPDIPRYEVWEVNSTIGHVATMEDNKEFRAAIGEKTLPTREFFNIDLDNGISGSADFYRPPGVAEGSQHPLLVYVYAGPGSLQVTSRYGYGGTINNWLRYLGSELNIAVASVDARGTVGKGEDWKFLMYKKLATIEVDDQIAFGKAIKARYSYINSADAAVFGWSYGGFVSSLVTGRQSDTYGCGVAVAPVTSKRYYDTAYTERYLGLASENPDAYNATDLVYLAENFKNKKYFIAHGTHDDNVHFRHFATFVHALVEAEVQFRQQIYVDEDHSISSEHQSRHLFQAMTDFLNNDCYTGFIPPTPPPTPAHATVPRSTFTLLTLALLVLFSATF